MLEEYLKNIEILNDVFSWEDAITAAANPLLNKKFIEKSYIKAMIDSVNKNGSYIVVIPQVALAHARPDTGVIKTGISFLKLNQFVMFPESKPVNIVMVLAANEEKQHLELMSKLAEIFMDDVKMAELSKADTVDVIQQILLN